jgi:hypothetical protein
MKLFTFAKHAIILGAFSALAVNSFGASLYLYSSATETANNSGSATVDIPANPAWAGPLPGSSWVSYVQSGDPSAPGFVSVPNGTVVNFTDTFFVAGTPIGGSILNVLADDTTSVILNGVTLVSQASTSGNSFATCSNTAIGCLTVTEGNVSLTGNLVEGLNTLTFGVEQVNGGSYGLDYAGTVNYSATPEPGTIALMGLPLVALSLIRRKRKGKA